MTTTIARRRMARDHLGRAMASPAHAWVLHYACEGFDTPERRITSIAARNLGDGATRSFELDTELRRHGLDPATASDVQLNEAEKTVLDAFYGFVSRNLNSTYWLHWNMRNATFGFAALENRHRLLGGAPIDVPEGQRLDLAGRMIDLYGDNYAAPENRLPSLAARNGLPTKHLIDGAEQAVALARRDYARVDRSLLNRIDILFAVAIKAHESTLKTHAGPFDALGGAAGLIPWLKENPVIVACAVAAPVLGAVAAALKVWAVFSGQGA